MSIADFINSMKNAEESLQSYIDSEKEEESDFQKFIKNINQNKIREDKEKFLLFLRLLISISKHQHRFEQFFDKIEKILDFLMEDIKKFFTQKEIFDIFKSNKRILLFFVHKKVIVFTEEIFKEICEGKFRVEKYYEYFYPETKQYLNKYQMESIMRDHQKELEEENFEENRQNGENHRHICKLIRDDVLDDFIVFVNQTNYPIDSNIEQSIFETHPLLCQKETTLIEYALFFGSINITKYLMLKGIKLQESSWIYAIHSNNAELISILEENHVEPTSYLDCLRESIKCHHLNISIYIQDNLINESDYFNVKEEGFKTSNITDFGLENYNFLNIIENDLYINPAYYLYHLIKYDYIDIACLLLKTKVFDVNYVHVFYIDFVLYCLLM